MKRIAISCLLTFCLFASAYASAPPKKSKSYQFSIDLTKVKDDKLTVNLLTPKMKKSEVVYYMPKIVPGTYANYDFGRFVSNFTARDKKGNVLPVEKLDANSWKIKDAKKLNRISYTVEDTWDTDQTESFVFEPGGTNIEDSANFVINTHGFFGYLDDMKRTPYEVTFTKPNGFYGSTSLTASASNATSDTYRIDSYMDLVDSPIMYNRPDTTVLKIGGADILVSVYSPNKVATSKEIATNIDGMLEAQKEYLGGELPIKKYAFLIYLFDKPTKSGSMGALEHSYSSLYTLPEASAEQLSQTVRDVASHEFFHILTPLSIHSEEIHDFNFNQPKMSKHLWMYEGVTEYSAGHMQAKYDLIDLKTYLGMLQEKMYAMEQFNDTLPFTEMSANVLEKYEPQYGNVYQKGALIGLVLDVKLRELSQGKYGIQNLMKDLAKTYGKDKPFEDSELFDKIAQLTYPEIRQFFARHVEGNEPLPLAETLAKVGIEYKESEKKKVPSLGNIQLGFNPATSRLIVANVEKMNEFGKKMGYQKNDELISVNGTKLDANNVNQVLGEFLQTTQEGDTVTMVVARKGEDDKEAEVTLTQPAILVEAEQKHILNPAENPTPEQLALRNAWLEPQK